MSSVSSESYEQNRSGLMTQTVADTSASSTARTESAGGNKNVLIWAFCACVIAYGGAIRFANLQHKAVFIDESITQMQVTGFLGREDRFSIFDRFVRAGDFVRVTQISPDSSINDTLEASVGTPYNPPVYFLLSRLWAQIFGAQISTLRCLSAVLSLFEAPCMYLLCLELFGSPLMGIVGAALLMVSPFDSQIAQLARPYSLWAVSTLVSSWLLLRAIRGNSKTSKIDWTGYAVSSAFSLYIHLSAIRVLLGNLVFALLEKLRDRSTKLKPFLCSIAVAMLMFVPWLFVLNNNQSSFEGAQWFQEAFTGSLAMSWLQQTQEVFVDLFHFSRPLHKTLMPYTVALVVLALGIFLRRAPQRSKCFVLTQAGASILTLVIPDLLSHSGRSTEARYMLPVALALVCIVTFVLGHLLSATGRVKSILAQCVLFLVLSTGAASCWSVNQHSAFFHYWRHSAEVASYLNKCDKPVLVGWHEQKATAPWISAIAQHTKPDAILAFSSHWTGALSVPEGATDIFVWFPTREQLDLFSSEGMNPKQQGHLRLWKLTPTVPR